jgi:hypothetical protein
MLNRMLDWLRDVALSVDAGFDLRRIVVPGEAWTDAVVKARLEESFGTRWRLTSAPSENGWKTVIDLYRTV